MGRRMECLEATEHSPARSDGLHARRQLWTAMPPRSVDTFAVETVILGSEHALGDDDMLRIAPDAAPAPTAWHRSDLARYTEGLPHELYQREVPDSLYIKCRGRAVVYVSFA